MKVCDRCGKPMKENLFRAIQFPKIIIDYSENPLQSERRLDLCRECEIAVIKFATESEEHNESQ